MMNEISMELALQLHEYSIEEYGGSNGIRDIESLTSALARPFATFAGDYLYSDPVERAAAIAESIIMNHPFVDGNKRTGFALMLGLLLDSRLNLTTTEDENYQFVVSIATGERRFEEAVEWLREHSARIA